MYLTSAPSCFGWCEYQSAAFCVWFVLFPFRIICIDQAACDLLNSWTQIQSDCTLTAPIWFNASPPPVRQLSQKSILFMVQTQFELHICWQQPFLLLKSILFEMMRWSSSVMRWGTEALSVALLFQQEGSRDWAPTTFDFAHGNEVTYSPSMPHAHPHSCSFTVSSNFNDLMQQQCLGHSHFASAHSQWHAAIPRQLEHGQDVLD